MFGRTSRQEKRFQARQIALEIEGYARRLNGLPPLPPDQRPDSVMDILGASATLLARLDERAPAAASASGVTIQDARTNETFTSSNAGPTLTPAPDSIETTTIVASDDEAEPPAAMQHLVRLRDWVLQARSDGGVPSPTLLDGLYRELGRVLEQEGIASIEDSGPFDVERHLVVETELTTDHALHDRISSTVRPGYRRGSRILRPQEVVLYAYSGAD